MGFIEDVAKYVKKYAPIYGVKVYSPTIAQVILESASGTSELAVNAHNYTGLKYDKNISELYAYVKTGSEQNKDGTYSTSVMKWCNFKSLESGIQGHFRFLFCRPGVTRYNNLKGITDPKKYLETIKADGYATSLKYVDNLMNVIKKYDLTKYDKEDNKENNTGKEETTKYYRVICGSYKSKSQADSKVVLLKSAGFSSIVKPYNDMYRVQVAACSTKASAEKIQNELKKKSFDSFISFS